MTFWEISLTTILKSPKTLRHRKQAEPLAAGVLGRESPWGKRG